MSEVIAAWAAKTSAYPSTFFLYGSRVNDALRGGDIDFVWCVPLASYSAVATRKREILSQIKGRIGEQRIDFSIINADEAARDPFWSRILSDAICLSRLERQIRPAGR